MASILTRPTPPIGAARVPGLHVGWPIRTFASPHPVRATFGEPRGLVGVAGARGLSGGALAEFLKSLNPLSVPGRRIIHHGIDIKAPDGTKIYAVTDGIARVGGGTGYGRWVQVGNFRYVHLKNTVAPGTRVRAFRTVLGTVFPGQEHVHFTRFWRGMPVNPLRFGWPAAYQDHAAPFIENMIAMRPNGQRVPLDELSGPIALVVRAEDIQSQGGLHSGLYRLGYTILDGDGRPAIGPYAVLQMDVIPPVSLGNLMYTVQATRHRLHPEIFYRLTLKSPSGDGLLRTGRMRPGRYTVQVRASDVRGNRTVRNFAIQVRPPH